MSDFQPMWRKGDMIQPRYGNRMIDAEVMEDSRMKRDCFGEMVEYVRYRHNPSGKQPCPDWHWCDGAAYVFVPAADRPAPPRRVFREGKWQ